MMLFLQDLLGWSVLDGEPKRECDLSANGRAAGEMLYNDMRLMCMLSTKLHRNGITSSAAVAWSVKHGKHRAHFQRGWRMCCTRNCAILEGQNCHPARTQVNCQTTPLVGNFFCADLNRSAHLARTPFPHRCPKASVGQVPRTTP